ncbi:PaaI family thioesterase [Aquabacterium sp.]|uniref:PaaI family thioesterase n=1 Tax=Aquabacterium sp. TaxID=1872578 RepID=UPI002C4010BA|nr:PaaI family thioesterase [Aquabacterium sp.]HSW07404.1 PaaI family thioesterase [Aquabacterium sp.]
MSTADLKIPPGFQPATMGGDFIGHVGPFYIYHEGDVVLMGFRVEKRHTNPFEICHGGMLASFADMLLPITVHRKSKEVGHRFLPTISLQVDYLAPAALGAWVQGEAQVLRATRSIVFVQGTVTADGAPCMRVSGIFKIGPAFKPPVVEG